ncbi:MAG: replication initiation protein [Panacagrimonas sp.]
MPEQQIAKQEFKKHVATIHTSGELSLLERKLSNVLLLHAYDNLLTQRTHKLPISVLCPILGYGSNDVAGLRKALRALVTTAIEFNLMQDGKEKWAVMSMLSYAEIRDGICTWRYDDFLAERLFDPEVYSTINIKVQTQFQSSHTLTLYENCFRYKAVGSTGWWDLDRFRKLMGANGESYAEFRRLNEKVIQPAIKEINKTSDIQLDVEFDRKGRGGKVSSVRFLIADNKQQVLFRTDLNGEENYRDNEAFKMLREVGVSEKLAAATVKQDEVWAMAIARSTQGKVAKGQIKNPGAYAAKLIREGAIVEPPAVVQKQIDKAREADEEKLRIETREKLRREFEIERKKQVMGTLETAQRKQLLADFVDFETKRGNGRITVGADLQAGRIMGLGASMFEIYATKKVLGDYTEAELDRYVASKLKASDRAAKTPVTKR